MNIHFILSARYMSKWNLDSRIMAFDRLSEALSRHFKKVIPHDRLFSKIENCLPSTHCKQFDFDSISLHDDALSVGEDGDAITLDIPLCFRNV